MTDQVHVQLVALNFRNPANSQLLWELRGDPMECHYAGTHWVRRAAEENPDNADVYQPFLERISGLADQPPPESGISAVINKVLRIDVVGDLAMGDTVRPTQP